MTRKEARVIERLLQQRVLQDEIGAENWDLAEDEETVLWEIIKRIESGDTL